jgi:Xaa-Pro aminopeptidase
LVKISPPAIKTTDATPTFQQARKVKSQREIEMLQHAVNITEEAFERVMAVAAPGSPEYEVQAQFEFTFLRRGGHWGYPCIVASGPNATTLHYQSNRETIKRPTPAARRRGRVRRVQRRRHTHDPGERQVHQEQADIYRLVYDAQQAAMKMARPATGSHPAREPPIRRACRARLSRSSSRVFTSSA